MLPLGRTVAQADSRRRPGLDPRSGRVGFVVDKAEMGRFSMTTVPVIALLPPNCISQPLQNLHVEMTSNKHSVQEVRTHGAPNRS
jgi:hypothetical protein